MEPSETIGQRIKVVRGELSQKEFGRRIGLSQTAVTALETNQSEPRLGTFNKIVEAFGASPEWLRTGKGEPLPNGRALTPAPPASPLRINTDGESEGYWKALAADLREQVKAAAEREKWLQHQFQELVGKSPASAYTAGTYVSAADHREIAGLVRYGSTATFACPAPVQRWLEEAA